MSGWRRKSYLVVREFAPREEEDQPQHSAVNKAQDAEIFRASGHFGRY
jgi:hypothetical protein